jgi:hypothetical protein
MKMTLMKKRRTSSKLNCAGLRIVKAGTTEKRNPRLVHVESCNKFYVSLLLAVVYLYLKGLFYRFSPKDLTHIFISFILLVQPI